MDHESEGAHSTTPIAHVSSMDPSTSIGIDVSGLRQEAWEGEMQNINARMASEILTLQRPVHRSRAFEENGELDQRNSEPTCRQEGNNILLPTWSGKEP